jgi:hypothetical protein
MLVVEDCIAAQMRAMVMKYPEGNQMGGHRKNSGKQMYDSEAEGIAIGPGPQHAPVGSRLTCPNRPVGRICGAASSHVVRVYSGT